MEEKLSSETIYSIKTVAHVMRELPLSMKRTRLLLDLAARINMEPVWLARTIARIVED